MLTLARGSGQGELPVGGIRPACSVSVVLFEVNDLESRTVDTVTGGLGFSHVVVDACEADEQRRPLLIDCRGRIRVWLPLCEGREFYGCVWSRVGQPYDA